MPDDLDTSSKIFLVLASGSPRRKELIQCLDLPFSVVSPKRRHSSETGWVEIDETPLPDESPGAMVQRLSRLKAEAVVAHLPDLLPADLPGNLPIILAADTTVVLDNEILGKPENPADARRMLQRLRAESHFVYTGYTVAVPAQTMTALPNLATPQQTIFLTRLHYSEVWLRAYTDAEIDAYIAGGSPLDKAGAYGIQDDPFAPVARLNGCFASVMGLPLGDVAATLAELGLSLPDIGPLCSQLTGTSCCQER